MHGDLMRGPAIQRAAGGCYLNTPSPLVSWWLGCWVVAMVCSWSVVVGVDGLHEILQWRCFNDLDSLLLSLNSERPLVQFHM